MEQRCARRDDLEMRVLRQNSIGLPMTYLITYHYKCICGVTNVDRLNEEGVENTPIFHSGYMMKIELSENYPSVDAPPRYQFLTIDDNGADIPHPWHPNIRYFGDYAGHVCLNFPDTYTDLAWGVDRVALYLRYDLYRAVQEPPYPEDLQVAEWVLKQGEPKGWIYFDQDEK